MVLWETFAVPLWEIWKSVFAIVALRLGTNVMPPHLRALVLGPLQTQGETFPWLLPIPALRFFLHTMKALEVQPRPLLGQELWLQPAFLYLPLLKQDSNSNLRSAAVEEGMGIVRFCPGITW